MGGFIIENNYLYGSKLVYRLIRNVFPQVDRELACRAEQCMNMPDETLGKQGLSSIQLKRFHAQGGSAYALYPGSDMDGTVRFITALQTISDYLDNLCDRAGVQDEVSFRQLHLSMMDAVDPFCGYNDYYRLYPYKNDGGYLVQLVDACRLQLSRLPSYHLVRHDIKHYVQLYIDLQSYKHLSPETREGLLETWAGKYLPDYPEISTWEFAAAAGSTLGMFVLFAASYNPKLGTDEVCQLKDAYFPWVCGLHILLDYYIDFNEDMQTGDLNFTSYYRNLHHCEERLSFFLEKSLMHVSPLDCSRFHITIIQGLLAMYLSDPKASMGLNSITSTNLIKRGGRRAVFYHRLCLLLRKLDKL